MVEDRVLLFFKYIIRRKKMFKQQQQLDYRRVAFLKRRFAHWIGEYEAGSIVVCWRVS